MQSGIEAANIQNTELTVWIIEDEASVLRPFNIALFIDFQILAFVSPRIGNMFAGNNKVYLRYTCIRDTRFTSMCFKVKELRTT